jgi:DNA-binding NarL/FixJ family response regulator
MPTRILIADDNALVRTAMRQVLESVGPWEIDEASNGKEAIAAAKRIKPSLIILDLAMPVKDGLTTAREMAKLLPDVPVLMHTLYWSPRIQLEALKAGVRKAVPKSESSVIVAAVQELLGAGAAPSEGQASEPVNCDPTAIRIAAATDPLEASGAEADFGRGRGPADQPGDVAGNRRAS